MSIESCVDSAMKIVNDVLTLMALMFYIIIIIMTLLERGLSGQVQSSLSPSITIMIRSKD